MRSSDCSSDLCSSDLEIGAVFIDPVIEGEVLGPGLEPHLVNDLIRFADSRLRVSADGDDPNQAPVVIETRLHDGNAGTGYFRSNSGGRSEEHTSELQSLMRNSYAV